MRILVIGAGIVGLATAWWLARDGHAVTVIDRESEVGRGASFANGAQLSYSYVAPMAAPSVLRSLPKWLTSRDSPIRFAPAADPAQWRWIAAFLRACTNDASALATARLLSLSFHSRASLHTILAETPMAFDHAANGKLVIQSSRGAMAEAEHQMRLQAAMGCAQEALTAAECIALEPGLTAIADRLEGGILTPSEEVGDCRKLCEALHATLAAPPFDVAFALGETVTRIATTGRRIDAVHSHARTHEADLYVLSAGIGSTALGRDLGIDIPVQPIRGYSITARVQNSNCAPVRSVTDSARKTVYAPVGGTIRVAGFAELGSARRMVAGPIPPARTAALAHELDSVFPGAADLAETNAWSGLRPATPTGLPAIGRTRIDNLLVNLGQGALGFTLAAGSAHLLADIVAGRPAAVAEADYRLRGPGEG